MLKYLKCLALALSFASPVYADGLGLGRVATPQEIAAWDHDVRPDGVGLPIGAGKVLDGEDVYAEKCAVCHGDFGEAVGRWPVLAGGAGTIDSEDPVKTIGSYWPYLSTVYDYVNRAMPFGDAGSLAPDEIYAITAYLLYVNDLVDEDFVLSNETFLDVKMPNEAKFYMDDRAATELVSFSTEPCMMQCKDAVKITSRARVLDVTPVAATAAAEGAVETTVEPAEEAAVVIDAELAKKGEKVFKKCKACHQLGDKAKNRTGPILNGIIGATVGAVEGYKYSQSLKKANADGMVWDGDAMAGFLSNPKKFMKGTKMTFRGLKKDQDIAAVVEYLKTFE